MNNNPSKKNFPNGNDWRNGNKRGRDNSYRNAQPEYIIEENKTEASFYLKNIREYDTDFPELRQPVELGSFASEKRQQFLQESFKSLCASSPTYGIKFLSN